MQPQSGRLYPGTVDPDDDDDDAVVGVEVVAVIGDEDDNNEDGYTQVPVPVDDSV